MCACVSVERAGRALRKRAWWRRTAVVSTSPSAMHALARATSSCKRESLEISPRRRRASFAPCAEARPCQRPRGACSRSFPAAIESLAVHLKLWRWDACLDEKRDDVRILKNQIRSLVDRHARIRGHEPSRVSGVRASCTKRSERRQRTHLSVALNAPSSRSFVAVDITSSNCSVSEFSRRICSAAHRSASTE